jgi:hypothetical protein
VWWFQYSGGAGPQWGGRYLLVSGSLLAVGAAVVLSGVPGAARWMVLGLAVLVTAAGVAWLSQLSHTMADGMRALPDDPDTVLVSREAHFLRAGGAFYTPERRWLTATDGAELRDAAGVADEVGARRVVVLAAAGRDLPDTLGAYTRSGSRRVDFVPGVPTRLVTYRHRQAE